jgi:hypothetical protein
MKWGAGQSAKLDVVDTLCQQSHYREVLRWEIFMEQELSFCLDLEKLAVLRKKGLGQLWATFEGGFFMFSGAKS